MKKLLTVLSLLFLTGCASVMPPSKTECKVHRAVNSPVGQGVIQGVIIGGAINPYVAVGALTVSAVRGQGTECQGVK